MKSILVAVLLVTGIPFLASQPAWGGDLSASRKAEYKAAKAAGKLREGPRGYLASASGSLGALANEVNAWRRDKYQDIANKRGVPLSAIEQSMEAKLKNR